MARIPPLGEDPAAGASRARAARRRCSTSTTGGCASRCRSRARRRPRTPGGAWQDGARPPARHGRARSTTTRRIASRSTCSSTAARSRCPSCSRRRPGDDEDWYAGRAEPLRRLCPPAVGRAARERGGERPMTAVSTYTEFDLCGPLPSGVTVLEASAGTGKTYTIAALAARYVAEGTPLERLLLVTFTRMATGELRDRVRERLVGCEQALSAILAGAPDPDGDPVVTLLADRRRGRGRASGATASPARSPTSTPPRSPPRTASARRCWPSSGRSATSIARPRSSRTSRTCSRRRSTISTSGASTAASRRGSTRAEALKIARAAVDNPMAELEPREAPTDSTAAMRYRLAKAVREELEQRKRRLAIMTYDDLLTRLNDTLEGRAARPRASGCAPATRSCWSTSSRTPTRSSGRSSIARSRTGASRSC